jgi:hypothetical protein
MSICPGCGGVLGRDCFNAEDCLWISEDMRQRDAEDAHHYREGMREEEARYWAQQQDNFYVEMQMAEWVADDLGPAAFAGVAA